MEVVNVVAELARTSRKEYDILPHDGGPMIVHVTVRDESGVFGICRCLGKSLWPDLCQRVIARKYGNIGDIDDLSFLLLLSPPSLIFWNKRKQLIEDNQISLLEENGFTELILTRFPRSAETLQHRKWTLNRFDKHQLITGIEKEMQLCEILANKHRCNYSAWDYRRWLLGKRLTNQTNLWHSVLLEELLRQRYWQKSHMMDVSGWAYRSHLLEVWLAHQCSNDRDSSSPVLNEILQEESVYVAELLTKTPENECLWTYRRSLDVLFLEIPVANVSITTFDPILNVEHSADKLQESDAGLSSLQLPIPSPYDLPWSALLYKRHLRSLLPRLTHT